MMTLTQPRQRDQLLIEEALHALNKKTGIQGDIKPWEIGDTKYPPDAKVMLSIDSSIRTYLVECKAVIDRKLQVKQVCQQFDGMRENRKLPPGVISDRNGQEMRGVLIAPYISREIAEYCRECGLEFIDSIGNAYLRSPGILVFITGEKYERNQQLIEAPKVHNSVSGQRVALALLCKPELAGATFKEIASIAGVSVGAAHKALENLALRSYLVKDQSVRRRLIQSERLFYEWALNYPTTLRETLTNRRFTATDPNWWERANINEFGGVWGGEVAGEHLTRYLKPETQTIYVPPSIMNDAIKGIATRFRLRADPMGKIEIIEKFWSDEIYSNTDTAPPILVYSELMALLDPRVDEVAKILKEKWIDPIFTQA
jgi:hypothetical protein